jgi:hypothetical protein
MNTYNLKMTRVYETNMEVDAEDEQDAQKRFEDLKDDLYALELEQCNVVDEKIELETKLTEVQKALLWFKQNGFNCYENDGTIYISVNEYGIQVSTSEVLLRAEMWDGFNYIW